MALRRRARLHLQLYLNLVNVNHLPGAGTEGMRGKRAELERVPGGCLCGRVSVPTGANA